MKIAIQGHPFKGKEVIQILENLGGKNTEGLKGTYDTFYYIGDKNEIGDDHKKNFPPTYKLYTLEEFEKEFPFKVGDLCVYSSEFRNEEIIVKILGMAIKDDCIMYEVGHKDIIKAHSYIYRKRHTLKPYKEMKEERNITLTLEKAKEWYKKGGELKEIALQAFTEKELIKVVLPKTWEEFCENHMIDDSEAYFDTCCEIRFANITYRHSLYDKNICPSKKSAEAHLAMIQLEQLRDCWRQGWEPDWNDDQQTKYCIVHSKEFKIHILYETRRFLSFPTIEMAKEFLECFRNLIEKAGDLI